MRYDNSFSQRVSDIKKIYLYIGILKEVMPQLFSPQSKQEIISKKELFSKILSYRMEERYSIEVISSLMKRKELALNSVGTITQTLSKIGKLLAHHTSKYAKPNIISLDFFSHSCYNKL